METIVLGGGCFWCLEAAYQLINGVEKVVSGFAGGHTANPTYEQVAYQNTGHAEVVQVSFNTQVISLDDIFDIFWAIHDPTTRNRQGHDVGPEYRSIILCHDERQRLAAEKSKALAASLWDKPITTEIKILEQFYPADEDQQNFFNRNPEMAYCQVVINPKLEKLKKKFTSHLKVA